MKRVLVIDAEDQGPFFLALEGGALTIGASATESEAVFRDVHIRRIHCEIEVADDALVLSAPTADSAAEKICQRRELGPDEELRLGHALLRLESAPADEAAEDPRPAMDETLPTAAEPTPSPAPLSGILPVSSPAASQAHKRLVVIDGPDQKQSFRLPYAGSISIGNSGKHADVCLHDFYVSRVHCQVETQGDKVLLTHAEGKHGTLINGVRITRQEELRLGDVLRVGNSHLRLEAADGEGRSTAAPAASEPARSERFATIAVLPVEMIPSPLPVEGAASLRQAEPHKALEGQTLGSYEIGPLLGSGHAGAVYRAQHVKTNQVVAFKALAPEFPASSAELQQFAQSLKAASPLHHANLVNLHGAGKNGPYCWIAREYIEGESADQLAQRLKEEGKLTWTRAVRAGIHLAKALAFLHEHKTVHGNITPHNVLISSSDQGTKLADLMLAAAIRGSRLQKTMMEKKLLAELSYMAPEQVAPDAFVDRLADLYAVGAVVYTIVTGEPPFTGGSREEIIAKIRETPVIRPSRYQRKIPFPFEGVVLKLLAKHQEDRYQTANDLLADLECLARDHKIEMEK